MGGVFQTMLKLLSLVILVACIASVAANEGKEASAKGCHNQTYVELHTEHKKLATCVHKPDSHAKALGKEGTDFITRTGTTKEQCMAICSANEKCTAYEMLLKGIDKCRTHLTAVHAGEAAEVGDFCHVKKECKEPLDDQPTWPLAASAVVAILLMLFFCGFSIFCIRKIDKEVLIEVNDGQGEHQPVDV